MELFTEGQKIALIFSKDSNLVEMTCDIEKIFDDRLDLVLPQYFMRYIEFLQVGQTLTAKAFSKLGTIDFNTIIISSPLEDCFSIELDYNSLNLTPGEELPMINAIEKIEIQKKDINLKTKTFELSTEYMKFYSDEVFELDEVFDCVLYLPKDYGIIKFKAFITERDSIYDNEYTASYQTMTEVDRQTLLYYMYMYSKDTD
ncbi:hypothetical protein IJ384_04960 [bacterium]|nr:hypothetical protein [bacterium]